MAAVPLNAHHRVASAADGRKMGSMLGTAKESANSSTLAPLPLLSLRKEEVRNALQGEVKVLVGGRGLTHRIPTTTRTSLSMDTANGLCRADASSAKIARILTRLTAPQQSAPAVKAAIRVSGERARLLRETRPEVNRLRRSPHLQGDHHHLGKRNPPDKAADPRSETGESLGVRATSVGQGRRLPVLRLATYKRRAPRAKSLTMTLLLMTTILTS